MSVTTPATPSAHPAMVHIVDDDGAVRDALEVMLGFEGFACETFPDGVAFLAAIKNRQPDCVLLDVHMPRRSGVEVLKELRAAAFPAPVIMISGQGDIPMAVGAIKMGAYDFIEKPFDVESVLSILRAALASPRRDAVRPDGLPDFVGCATLTPRERDVLGQIAHGASNKEAGRRLGISPRTVEVHRARIMEKLGARNAADLVRIVLSDAARP